MNLINKSNALIGSTPKRADAADVKGTYTDKMGERFYEITNVDRMPVFFMTLVSDSDHWLFIASNGGLSAGRVSPETALFPYTTVDKVYDSINSTGAKTSFYIQKGGKRFYWEPFVPFMKNMYRLEKRIYKNVLGDKIIFEDKNLDLDITYSYMWATSEKFGFVKKSFLENNSDAEVHVEVLDGLRNILPAHIDYLLHMKQSCLADAYKQTELDTESGLGIFGLASQITDKAEPKEALRANVAWSAGLEDAVYLISDSQIDDFTEGKSLETETLIKGKRGSYLVNAEFFVPANESKEWLIAADVFRTQSQVTAIKKSLLEEKDIMALVEEDINTGSINLKKIIGAADGLQTSEEENTTVHHFANVLFNCMRGGTFADNYSIDSADLVRFINIRNKKVYTNHKQLFDNLPSAVNRDELVARARETGDADLERLFLEYLPVIFSRRHGDPSRPWNKFAIHIKDEQDNMILNYQGNWRDIFQNWEALTLSYPGFIENIIAKFANASTIDGYNPYRISTEGIDWEKIDPDDPWSNIGYWGDHQTIYLLKFLEWHKAFFPGKLEDLLAKNIFTYADVPYKILPYKEVLKDPYNTIDFDDDKENRIAAQLADFGSDARLVQNADGNVYTVNLTEKLLCLFLSKLSNFIPDGGIWMNTQRPEWNDANNALVGYGLSMVTLYYLHRFLTFVKSLFASCDAGEVEVSNEIIALLTSLENVFKKYSYDSDGKMDDKKRKQIMDELGEAGSSYRWSVYEKGFSGKSALSLARITAFIDTVMPLLDKTIKNNICENGLVQSYNLISYTEDTAQVSYLYEMLEGQVSGLSAGYFNPKEVLDVTRSLTKSSMFREDQHSYMLYPNRELKRFFDKNVIPKEHVTSSKLLRTMLDRGVNPLISIDPAGNHRFGSDCTNARDLEEVLDKLAEDKELKVLIEAERKHILSLYENIFNHHSFTGRSGGMYAYEGLGSIYWHMVSKLLLAVQENYFAALESGADKETIESLARSYYDVREGIGFNKTPEVYGAFPTDPYSHTPFAGGAQQPGMTGQVKEEVITRQKELGVMIEEGQIVINPVLLKEEELLKGEAPFTYLALDGDFKTEQLSAGQLGFTYCQVPIIYTGSTKKSVTVYYTDGTTKDFSDCRLDGKTSSAIFGRTGEVIRITAEVTNLLNL